jgi:hypothetical protein
MSIDPRAFEAAMAIQKEFEDRFAALPDILGIGLCLNAESTGPALNVQVTDEPAKAHLPQTFHDLEVIVDIVGENRRF